MLKGTELLDTIRSMETASRTEQCLACGYVRENGTIHVMLPLHRDSVLLTLMVGSDVIHFGHGT